jgi:hypothetical protein
MRRAQRFWTTSIREWGHSVKESLGEFLGANNVDQDNRIKWYSGTWSINGCPECRCPIECIPFVGKYDYDKDEWLVIKADCLCPKCGTDLKQSLGSFGDSVPMGTH